MTSPKSLRSGPPATSPKSLRSRPPATSPKSLRSGPPATSPKSLRSGPPATSPETLTAKGRQTRDAIERAARKLFAERGFHGTTLTEITSAAGKSPAAFYRYYTDKEDLLAMLAESFLRDVVAPLGPQVRLPDSPDDSEFFVSAVTGYWNMFKQNIGIMVAVDQLATVQPRFIDVQNEFRRFGMDIVRASVLRAQDQGFGADLDPEHTALAISLLFERFTTVYLREDTALLGVSNTDENAVRTLSTIWKKTLYGF